MTEKYYTPTIEEFHIGFEYEYKPTFFDGTVKTQEDFDSKQWIKDVFNNNTGIEYIDRALNGQNAKNKRCGIRVKYLDKEDIESFNFICCGKDQMFDYIGYMNADDFEIQDWGDNKFSIEKFPYSEGRTIHFVGIIKNKSELKILLKQLQIL